VAGSHSYEKSETDTNLMARNKRRGGAITGRPTLGSKQQKPGSIPFQAELALAFQHMQAGHVVEAESIYRQIVARHKTHP